MSLARVAFPGRCWTIAIVIAGYGRISRGICWTTPFGSSTLNRSRQQGLLIYLEIPVATVTRFQQRLLITAKRVTRHRQTMTPGSNLLSIGHPEPRFVALFIQIQGTPGDKTFDIFMSFVPGVRRLVFVSSDHKSGVCSAEVRHQTLRP